MTDSELLQKMQAASIEERIAWIELLLQSLKAELAQPETSHSVASPVAQRPAFGFMQGTGEVLGDIISPVLPETAWEALQ